jgi:uncharacterized glyoxalase superfamily protein PhnB
MPKVKPIPDGYHAIAPYLAITGAAAAIDFYKRAFGATELMRMTQPDGRVGHTELQLGDSRIMLADEFTLADPFGHVWHVSTHTEDLSPDEIGKRAAAQHKG